MRRPLLAGVLLSVAGSPTASRAQASYPAARPLPAIAGASAETFRSIATIRVLTDGRVLVLDPGGRRIVLLDSTLQHATVVADTTAATQNAWGAGFDGLAYVAGDSSMVRDVQTGAFVVLGPDGRVARIAGKAPAGSPLRFLYVWSYDQRGGILVRDSPPVFLSLLPPDFTGDTLMVGPDSVAILRFHLGTTRVDTAVMLKAPRTRQAVSRPVGGRGTGRSAYNPMPVGDDWTLLHDGTIAIVRSSDYHVDWVSPAGTVESSPRVGAPRVAIANSTKVAMIDSLRRADSLVRRSGMPIRSFVDPSDLPDFQRQFVVGNTVGDEQDNLWVLDVGPAAGGGLEYDVISRTGLMDRLRIPTGRAILGVANGFVYFTQGTMQGLRLVKARIR